MSLLCNSPPFNRTGNMSPDELSQPKIDTVSTSVFCPVFPLAEVPHHNTFLSSCCSSFTRLVQLNMEFIGGNS